MIKLILIILIGIFYVGYLQPKSAPPHVTLAETHLSTDSAANLIAAAFASQQSNVQVQGQGTVNKILKDDNDGHRHQRFILRMADGHTVLVAHNIELAARIADLQVGDTVEFYGEYEWNPKGGVVHWTHHDPHNQHPDGWLRAYSNR